VPVARARPSARPAIGPGRCAARAAAPSGVGPGRLRTPARAVRRSSCQGVTPRTARAHSVRRPAAGAAWPAIEGDRRVLAGTAGCRPEVTRRPRAPSPGQQRADLPVLRSLADTPSSRMNTPTTTGRSRVPAARTALPPSTWRPWGSIQTGVPPGASCTVGVQDEHTRLTRRTCAARLLALSK
jgi:hypothetical protein